MLDGDGKLDMATVGGKAGAPHEGVVTIVRATGGGAFAAPVEIPLGAEVSAATMAAGDVDGDGKVDLVVVRLPVTSPQSDPPASIDVIRNLGGGAFAAPVTYTGGLHTLALALADVDGDGSLDILTGADGSPPGPSSDGLLVLKNQGDGTFATGVSHPQLPLVIGLATADFDGDGAIDVAWVAPGGTLGIALGDGAGGFGPPVLLPAASSWSSALSTGDLDGDGLVDLVLTDGGGSVSVRMNQGGGTFAAAAEYPLESWATITTNTVTLVDLDGDGLLDVAQVDGNGHVHVRLNQGGGVLGSALSFAAGDRGYGIAAGDLDGDGHPDLAIANQTRLNVLPNRGDGTLVSRVDVPCGDGPREAVLVDYDGDGRLDVITGNWAGGVSALRNLGGGAFAAPVKTATDSVHGRARDRRLRRRRHRRFWRSRRTSRAGSRRCAAAATARSNRP
ncbi:MAG: VCBS repeat-containing protein [Minicystis sp.]